MSNGLPYKTKQFFFVLIKLSIVAAAFYFIYQKLMHNEHLSFFDFSQILIENRVFSFKNVFFLIILTIFNWFLEVLKWQKLVSVISRISFLEAAEQSLGALTASLFTPNRIGEYGAKAMYFQRDTRKKIMLLNLLGNSTQMAITTIIGCIGLVAFYYLYSPKKTPFNLSIIIAFIITALAFFIFIIKSKKLEFKGFTILKILSFVKNISTRIKLQVINFSLLRYLIFSFQFWLLLYLFKVDLSYLEAMVLISSMYLLSSIIPSIFIFDVVVKSGVAVYLFSFAGIDELIILSITMLMWLLNFVLPSVFGSYYVLNFNLQTSE